MKLHTGAKVYFFEADPDYEELVDNDYCIFGFGDCLVFKNGDEKIFPPTIFVNKFSAGTWQTPLPLLNWFYIPILDGTYYD